MESDDKPTMKDDDNTKGYGKTKYEQTRSEYDGTKRFETKNSHDNLQSH